MRRVQSGVQREPAPQSRPCGCVVSPVGDEVTWLSIPLGRFRLRLHLTLPLAAALMWWASRPLGESYLLLLGTLGLHETGHALACLALGGRGATVNILPVFGWADVETLPDRRQGWVALAGPAANLLLAAALAAAGAAFEIHLGRAVPLDFLLTVNVLMGLGNLLPVLPADGGRALAAFRAR